MPAEPDRPARLPVDRAFHLKGLGRGGDRHARRAAPIRPGRHAGAAAAAASGRGCAASRCTASRARQAEAGERTSLQLTGVALEELAPRHAARRARRPSRRPPACSPASPCCRTPRRRCAASCRCALHLYASEVLGRMRPLAAEGLAPGRDRAGRDPPRRRRSSAVRGDRFIVRRPSPPATLGGGEILDPRWRRHRGTILRPGPDRAPGGPPRRPRLLGAGGRRARRRGGRAGPPAGRAAGAGGRRELAALAPRPAADRGARGARARPALDRPRRRAAGHRARPARAQGVLPEGPPGRVDAQGRGGAPHPARPGGGAGATSTSAGWRRRRCSPSRGTR